MLKNTFPYSNKLKINLHTRLDDGKDPKYEINDKTKNELKEKIKNELEKDLKFEIGDKTKNELKEKIKNELEKDLKFEIDDKTKNEIKDKIKKEIEDEIDCKRDKNGKKEKDSDDKDGDDKVIEGKLVSLGHIDKEMCGENAEKYSAEKHVGKPAWFTRDLLKQFLPDLMKNDKIMSHFDSKSTDQYHAENFGITFKCEDDEECGKNINFTFAAPSNMWCNKGGALGNAALQCREEIRSINKSSCCPTAAPYSDTMNSENFFLNEKCPNLVLDLPAAKLSKCSGKTIVAKLEACIFIM